MSGDGIYSLRHRIQTASRAHQDSYLMGTVGSCSESKAAGSWSWPLNCI